METLDESIIVVLVPICAAQRSEIVEKFSNSPRAGKKMLRADDHTRTFRIAGSRGVFARPVHFSVGDFFR